MDNVKYNLFLSALKAALQDKKVSCDTETTSQDWINLFRVSSTHQVLLRIYEAVYSCSAAKKLDTQILMPIKQQTIVVKGIVCRNLYPH